MAAHPESWMKDELAVLLSVIISVGMVILAIVCAWLRNELGWSAILTEGEELSLLP